MRFKLDDRRRLEPKFRFVFYIFSTLGFKTHRHTILRCRVWRTHKSEVKHCIFDSSNAMQMSSIYA